MAPTHTLSRATVTRRAVADVLLLVALGVAGGLLFGLSLVHLLGWLGVHVDSGTTSLLRRAFLP